MSVPVDVVGDCLSRSLFGFVEAIGLVTDTLASDFGTAMLGFTVLTLLLTVRGSVVVFLTVVGVTVFVILADVTGLFVGISVEERVDS